MGIAIGVISALLAKFGVLTTVGIRGRSEPSVDGKFSAPRRQKDAATCLEIAESANWAAWLLSYVARIGTDAA